MHKKHHSKGSIDFAFWGEYNTSYSKHTGDEFQFQAHNGDGFGTDSPPLWKPDGSRITYESSPLLPYNHQYSNFSPRMRTQAIAEGRRELMEMVHDMPEWSYELSLKDIVDEQNRMKEVEEEAVIDERSYYFENEAEIKKQKKKKKKTKSIKSGEMSRSESMEKETILIKMFFPRSLGSKKNSTIKNRSKVSPRTSFDISENNNDKERWTRRSVVAGENESNIVKHYSSSSNNSNSSTSRQSESKLSTGCWPFFHSKKSKTKRPTGCIF